MKSMGLVILMVVSLKASAGDDLTKVARCNWGYINTASVINKNSQEKLYPGSLTSWELCKLAFETDLNHEGSDWVSEALSFLPIPPNQVRPVEMMTKKGQCEIGSILFQKKFLSVHDSVAIKLTAKGVCHLIPSSF